MTTPPLAVIGTESKETESLKKYNRVFSIGIFTSYVLPNIQGAVQADGVGSSSCRQLSESLPDVDLRVHVIRVDHHQVAQRAGQLPREGENVLWENLLLQRASFYRVSFTRCRQRLEIFERTPRG